MLIKEKQPQGHIYPQITQAPINYFNFLNFFRGGHTIDDNLGATVIANSLQANLLNAALTKSEFFNTHACSRQFVFEYLHVMDQQRHCRSCFSFPVC